MDKKLRSNSKYIFKQLFFWIFSVSLFFAVAGDIRWPMGWIYSIITLLVGIANYFVADEKLIVERSSLQKSTTPWDFFLALTVAMFGPLIVLIVAALDFRFDRQFYFPLPVKLVAIALLIAGAGIAIWAMRENKYFSATVRIQEERNHLVVETGPYAYVRHPGYTGAILGHIAVPLILDSLNALFATVILLTAIIFRTYLEDDFLKKNLEGYKEYSSKVKHLLFWLLW